MAEGVTYQPKGSMCLNCHWAFADCSGKDFSSMKPLERNGEVIIVKCKDRWVTNDF